MQLREIWSTPHPLPAYMYCRVTTHEIAVCHMTVYSDMIVCVINLHRYTISRINPYWEAHQIPGFLNIITALALHIVVCKSRINYMYTLIYVKRCYNCACHADELITGLGRRPPSDITNHIIYVFLSRYAFPPPLISRPKSMWCFRDIYWSQTVG